MDWFIFRNVLMKKRSGRSMLKILEKSQNLPFESDPKLKGMME